MLARGFFVGRSFARCLFSSAVFFGMIRSSVARADEVPFSLAYRAPPGCPSWTRFLNDVTLRTPRVRLDPHHRDSVGVEVEIAEERKRATGRLFIRDPDGARPARVVEGVDCTEVASALALIVALALDPHASVQPIDASPRPSPASPPDTLPASGVRAMGVALPESSQRPDQPTRKWHMSAGAGAALSEGAAPWILPMGGLFGEASRDDDAWPWRTRVSLVYGLPATGDVSAGQARFWLGFIRAAGCPWSLRLAPRLAGLPCVSVDVGRMRAEGLAGPVIRFPDSATVWWVTPGVGVRIDIEMGGLWFAEPSAGAGFPLVRESFAFALPSGTLAVHRASPVVGEIWLGFGAHFR